MSPIAQKTLFDLTQDGLVIGNKLKPLYPDFDVSAFVSDVREEMQNQTIYNVTNAIGKDPYAITYQRTIMKLSPFLWSMLK